MQIVFGVTDASDAAIPVVERLKAEFPARTIALVVAPAKLGANPKVANLVNMSGSIAHDIVVVADSDIRVPPDYLRRIVIALERQDGGAVTCPYYGIASGGLWSRLSRLNIDGHFLPGVMVGRTAACFAAVPGPPSHSAAPRLRRSAASRRWPIASPTTTPSGEALAKRGEPVGVLRFAVGHVCAESSAAELWQHELRWATTIRSVDPVGYLGWSVAHAFPLAAIALGIGGGWPALSLAAAALACRAALLWSVQRAYDLPAHPYWLIPLRDLWSFAVFAAGFVARGVRWKDNRYRLMSQGALMPERRSPQP